MNIKNLDAIIGYLYHDKKQSLQAIKNTVLPSLSTEEIRELLIKIISDGFAREIEPSHPVFPILYTLTIEGCLFYEKTFSIDSHKQMPYALMYDEIEEQIELRKEDEEKVRELNQSVIDTNKSVQSVNKLFWAILAFTIVSALGTIGTFGLELYKILQKTPQQKQLEPQVKEEKKTKPEDSLVVPNITPKKNTGDSVQLKN